MINMSIKAIFFDLDDTLYDYKTSSRIAMEEVYKKINQKYKIEIKLLQEEYGKILRKAEDAAFIDGRTSKEHRSKRFRRLLKQFNIEDENLILQLLDVYSDILEKNMKIDKNVHLILNRLKEKFNLYLITEGPSDAQRKTVDLLGLKPYFTNVFISGEIKKRKADGELFKHALKEINHKPEEIVLVGDSYETDVKGGLKAGLKVIWLNKKGEKIEDKESRPHNEIKNIEELFKAIKTIL